MVIDFFSKGLMIYGYQLSSSYEYNDPNQLIAGAFVTKGLNVFVLSVIFQSIY